MSGDPKACREHAKRCWALASEVTNPALKNRLVEAAQRWSRLAVDLEAVHILLKERYCSKVSPPRIAARNQTDPTINAA